MKLSIGSMGVVRHCALTLYLCFFFFCNRIYPTENCSFCAINRFSKAYLYGCALRIYLVCVFLFAWIDSFSEWMQTQAKRYDRLLICHLPLHIPFSCTTSNSNGPNRMIIMWHRMQHVKYNTVLPCGWNL